MDYIRPNIIFDKLFGHIHLSRRSLEGSKVAYWLIRREARVRMLGQASKRNMKADF